MRRRALADVGGQLQALARDPEPLVAATVGALLLRLATVYAALLPVQCDHRWVQAGLMRNKRSGWLECTQCHVKQRALRRVR